MNKEKRVKILVDFINKIKEIQGSYIGSSSGWVLLQAAKGHITSLHHLEDETDFDEEILGVKVENRSLKKG